MTVRMELTAALHHSAFKGAGPETHDAPRSQKTVNSKREAELFSLLEEELGGTRPDRLSDVRPQERVQRHTVEHLTDLVRFCSEGAGPRCSCAAGGGTAGRRPGPGGKEGKGRGREDGPARGKILTRHSMSAADKEAWRRWAKAGGPRPRKKEKKKRKLPRTSLRPVARVPAVQARDHGGAPVPVLRPSARHSSCMQRQVRSHTVQVCDFTGAAFEHFVDVPVVVRQGSGLDAQVTVEVPQLQFLAKVDVLVVVQRQVLWSKQCRTLEAHSCSSWKRLLTCPLFSATRACGCPDSAVLGQGCCRAQCCARQVLMAVQQFWTSVDVPVVAHDREMPQIQLFARV